MKKRILAALLAMMMFASTAISASPANFASQQEVEQFFELLDSRMEVFLRQLTADFGDRFWSFSLGRSLRWWDSIEEIAEHYNNSGDMLGGFGVRMSGLSYVQLRHEETLQAETFAFGANITRSDVVRIVNFVFGEYGRFLSSLAYPGIRRGEFTVPRVLEVHGLNTNQFINIFWEAVSRATDEDIAHFIETYGDSWLYILIHNHVHNWVESIGFNGRMDFPMRELMVYALMVDALGLRRGVEFFHGFTSSSIYFNIWRIFTRETFGDVMLYNPQFIERLTDYVETYGVDGFLEILDFDMMIALYNALENDIWFYRLDYLDSLLGGLLSENLATVAEWSSLPHNRNGWWVDLGRTTQVADISLSSDDANKRLSFDISTSSAIRIVGDIDSGKINIFFHNSHDQAVLFMYHLAFYTFNWDFSTDNIWVGPGDSFFVQYNLTDLEFNLDYPEYRWQYTMEAHFSIINPYGRAADGEFAFRWIE